MSEEAYAPGRTAYEARFEGFTLGPRGVAPAWKQLLPAHQAIWARVETAVREQCAARLEEVVSWKGESALGQAAQALGTRVECSLMEAGHGA